MSSPIPASPDRVVVTGMTAITALGPDLDSTWRRLIAGESGLRTLESVAVTGYGTTFGGEIAGLPPHPDRFTTLAIIAAAALDVPSHAGIRVGTAFGGIGALEAGAFDRSFASVATDALADRLGLGGPRLTYQASFTAGANAIGEAFEAIRSRRESVIVAGAVEAAITPTILAGFVAMGATSQSTGDPVRAVKPFARDRDGCAIGEGATLFVLESLDHAMMRGATIFAEIVGYGTAADAYHVVALPEGGDGIVRAMRLAMDQAAIAPTAIGYLNAHGTGTTMNDVTETRAMRIALGEAAGAIPVSSTKPATGHLLGAAGALELAITIQAQRTGIAPPTLNLEVPDPDCDLDYIPLSARQVSASYAMSNSMGFGGHAASLIVRRWPEP